MKTCACCGQVVASSESSIANERQGVAASVTHERVAGFAETSDRSTAGRFTVSVDDGLGELCNEAYADAERRGSAEVEIAHVVLRFTLSPAHRACFEKAAVSRVALFDAANVWLAESARGGTGSAPQTSADLKLLLARAEEAASLDERSYASAGDFLHALMTRSNDLVTASFVRNVRGYADYKPPTPNEPRGAGVRVREVQLELELRRVPVKHTSGQRAGERDSERSGGHRRERFEESDDRPVAMSRRDERDAQDGAGWSGAGAADRWERVRLQDRASGAARTPPRSVPDSHGDDDRGQIRRPVGAQEAYRARSAIEQGRVAFERERQLAQGSPAEHQALLERLHRQEGQLAELRALLSQVLTARGDGDAGSGSGNADSRTGGRGDRDRGSGSGRGRASGLRWARVRSSSGGGSQVGIQQERNSRKNRGSRRLSGRNEEDTFAGEAFGDSQGRACGGGDGGEGQQRLRVMREPRELADLEDGLAPADNDTEEEGGTGERMKRFYLSPDDDIVRAPSIGPRTAARLIPVGLVLVRDLLNCDPEAVAAKVGARYMPAARIAEWRAQARLVCTIPWLRGTHAQLLVGAGFDTLAKLVRADASAVCAAVLRFAGTREGQGILRSGPAPEIDRIACWIENTAMAEPSRAA